MRVEYQNLLWSNKQKRTISPAVDYFLDEEFGMAFLRNPVEDYSSRFFHAEALPLDTTSPAVWVLNRSLPASLQSYAGLVERREINWERTFARRKLCFADYRLLTQEGPQSFCYTRRDALNRTIPEHVMFGGGESAALTSAVLQGDLVVSTSSELALSYSRNQEFAVEVHQSVMPATPECGQYDDNIRLFYRLRGGSGC